MKKGMVIGTKILLGLDLPEKVFFTSFTKLMENVFKETNSQSKPEISKGVIKKNSL